MRGSYFEKYSYLNIFGFRKHEKLRQESLSDHTRSKPPSLVSRGVSRPPSYQVASTFAASFVPSLSINKRIQGLKVTGLLPAVSPALPPSLSVTIKSLCLEVNELPQLPVVIQIRFLGFQITKVQLFKTIPTCCCHASEVSGHQKIENSVINSDALLPVAMRERFLGLEITNENATNLKEFALEFTSSRPPAWRLEVATSSFKPRSQ